MSVRHRAVDVVTTWIGKERHVCDKWIARTDDPGPPSGVTQHYSVADASALLDRYLIDLDTATLDDAWAEDLFTTDVEVDFPNAGHRGIAGLAAFHRESLAVFARTQHLNSPAVLTVEGSTVVLRANLVSTHVLSADSGAGDSIFVVGSLVEGHAVSTELGWRLRVLSFRLVWSTGRPPSAR